MYFLMTTDFDDHSRYLNAKATSGRLNQRSAIDTGKNNWGQSKLNLTKIIINLL